MKAFTLPRGKSNWHEVQARIEWCKEAFGPRQFGGAWEYNAVSHMIVTRTPEYTLMYTLRWGS